MKMTSYRREFLMRIRDNGPLTVDEARQGHPNIMPKLLGVGYVDVSPGTMPPKFAITEAGRAALEGGV